MNEWMKLATVLSMSIGLASPSMADDVLELGAYLSGECVTCHQAGTGGTIIPHLAGRNREEILNALAEYKSGQRQSPVMRDIARQLAEDEAHALAAYFSSLSTQ